jgi:hypothetical protein
VGLGLFRLHICSCIDDLLMSMPFYFQDGLPVEFPLQIEDRPRERIVLYSIRFHDESHEIIKVEADIPQIGTEDEDDKKDDIETIPLFVTITQKSGMSLQIGVTASYSEIYIDSSAMKQPEVSKDQLTYEDPVK